jgi:EAL domain-containing protein (putative c-di-GMP-specific phosphodiesterase class I)
VRSSASVGLTLADRSTTPDELLRQADVALYRAKALGRSCLATYSVDEDRGLDADLDLEPELRRAVDRDEFTLHYQPIIDLQTGQVVSVEALLRWEHPRRGHLGPAAFLDQAISSGLLGAIGESSLRTACADFASIDATDVGHALPSVAVNLSSSELADRRVVARVAAALADSGLAPRRLTLEITEDVIIDESVRSTIDELRALGVYLAIDDFGTGNSSLRQLGAYPAAVLKVDKSFVDRIEVDGSARAITAAIIRMSRNLGLTTVAEGVETPGQAELLAGMGCDRIQGWLISKALPFEELTGWCVTNCPIGPYRDSRESVSSASSMMRASSSATGGRSSIAPTT